jgi:putative endonuclease
MRLRTLEARKAAEKRGRRGEFFAAALLVCKGYRILGWRVKTKAGEIDLIAKTLSGVVCFIEVKARPDEALATDAIGLRQRGRIARAAELFLAGRASPFRFDVITVVPGSLPRHRKDAWRPDGL